MRSVLLLSLIFTLILPHTALAQIPEAPAEDDEINRALEKKYSVDYNYVHVPKATVERYTHIADSLNCHICKKNKLSEITSPLTTMLREDVYYLIKEGKTDEEIYDFINNNFVSVINYGKDSPDNELEPDEYIPLGICIIALIVAFIFIRRKEKAQKQKLKDE
jgi:cytochrome c-type biogenesis protein CcmH/NrfF